MGGRVVDMVGDAFNVASTRPEPGRFAKVSGASSPGSAAGEWERMSGSEGEVSELDGR